MPGTIVIAIAGLRGIESLRLSVHEGWVDPQRGKPLCPLQYGSFARPRGTLPITHVRFGPELRYDVIVDDYHRDEARWGRRPNAAEHILFRQLAAETIALADDDVSDAIRCEREVALRMLGYRRGGNSSQQPALN